MVLFAGWIFVIGLYEYVNYEASPHFRGRLNSPLFHIGNMGPNTVGVASYSVAIENYGRVPGNITRWEVRFRGLDRKEITGGYNVIQIAPWWGKDYIHQTARHIEPHQTVYGIATFMIPMVRMDALGVPGTKFRILYREDTGRQHEIDGDVSAEH